MSKLHYHSIILSLFKNITPTAAHRITVEPITDQSMQYNDLYVPRDPSQSKCYIKDWLNA